MRIRSIIISTLLCFMILISGTAIVFSQSERDELIVNGSFEEDWNGWMKYTLDRGYASLDPSDPFDGRYSLAIQGTATPQVGKIYGSGARQIIEVDSIPLDLDFEFWVKPWFSGKGTIEIDVTLSLYVTNEANQPSVFNIVYHIAWKGGEESWANIPPDQADYFVYGAAPFNWNNFRTNIKNDFEDRWGSSNSYSLSRIELKFEIRLDYKVRGTQYANWDAVSLTSPRAVSAVTETESNTITSGEITSRTSSSETMDKTSETTQSTKTRIEEISILARSEFITTIIILILAIIIVAIVLIRRRKPLTARQQIKTGSVRYCINCGSPISATARYCQKCGSNQ